MAASSPSLPSKRSAALGRALTIGAALLSIAALPSTAAAEQPNADAYPRVELVTMGIGSLIWERHGHIALCVRYSDPRRDRCYNYGVADFANPIGMGSSFFRGKKSFWVAASPPKAMLSIYLRADRTVWVQRLPLTPSQKKKVIDKLRFDIKIENRYYAYDHFFDNCTTRVRDILDDAMDGALKKIATPIGDSTIRDYARKGFYGMRWALLVTDFFMGRVTDQVPSYWQRLYLPDYMRQAFDEEFGVKPVGLYQRQGTPPPDESPTGRFLLFFVILVLTSPAWATLLLGRFQRTGMFVAIFVPALVGLIIWIGVVGSPVPYVRWTEMFFIFVPFDFALPFFRGRVVKGYARFRVAMLLLVSLLLAVGVFKQPLLVPVLWPLIPCAVVAFAGGAFAGGAFRKVRAEGPANLAAAVAKDEEE